MSTAVAGARSNVTSLQRLVPNWAWALFFLALAVLYPYILDQLLATPDDLLDASIQTLGYIIMALGLNIVVGFAGLLAGAAGMIYALYNGTIQFNQGFTAGLIAFTAAVMGGIGNRKGAVVGGLIIGVIQSISDTHFGQVWTPAVVFAILILIMVFKPQGLFGEETREG
jgi:ABC-type branched-subunit amino acid transport system permease subunit